MRQKINTEEEAFELEYQNRTTQKSDLGIKERQDRLMALKDEREEKRRNFVQQKKLQQALYIHSIGFTFISTLKLVFPTFSSNCDTIRPALQKMIQQDATRGQIGQMEDKKRRIAVERDTERAWDEISKKAQQQQVGCLLK